MDRWREDSAIAGAAGIDLHWAMMRLGEELRAKEQDGRTPPLRRSRVPR
jgi:hypothetical protein